MRAVLFSLVVSLVAATGGAQDAVKKDMEKLEGEFSMISGMADGQAMPESSLKNSRRLAKDGVTTVMIGDMLLMKAKFTIDPSKKPKTIDYMMLEGLTKGKTQFGIYEIDGDTVRFCFASPGMERATDFTSKPGSGRTLSVWKRVKK